jgi:ABC-2 type transport system permease protein
MGLIAALVAHFSFGPQMPPSPDNTAVGALTGGVRFAGVIVIAFACMMITGEYSTGMIRSTLAAQPRRSVAFAAKAAVAGLVAILIGVVSDVVTYLVSLPLLPRDRRIDLLQWTNLRPLIGMVLFLLMWTVLALAVGTLLRNTAAAIVVLLCWFFVIENLIASIPWHFFRDIAPYLPLQASQLIIMSDRAFAISRTGFDAIPLSSVWEGYGVGLIWTVVLVALAMLVFRRRDV